MFATFFPYAVGPFSKKNRFKKPSDPPFGEVVTLPIPSECFKKPVVTDGLGEKSLV